MDEVLRTSNTTALTTCICVMNVQHRHGTCKQGELREGSVEMRTGAQPHGYHWKLPARKNRQARFPGCRPRCTEGIHVIDAGPPSNYPSITRSGAYKKLCNRNVKSFDIQTSLQQLDISYAHSPLAKKKIASAMSTVGPAPVAMTG